jgi:hypothetical protein
VTWTEAGPSCLNELTGVPGQMRLDVIPSNFMRKGTQVFRRTVDADKALGFVAINDTQGSVATDWRSFGITWGSDDGITPAFGFPLLGSALESKPIMFGQTTINATTTTYTLAPADYINTYIGLAGTPGGALTVTVPTAPGSSVFRFIFNNSLTGGYGATITTGSGRTVSVPYSTSMEVCVIGANVVPVDAVNYAQPTRAGQLTDSTGGTPGATIASAGTIFNEGTLNNNFASLTQRINALEAMLHNLGLST